MTPICRRKIALSSPEIRTRGWAAALIPLPIPPAWSRTGVVQRSSLRPGLAMLFVAGAVIGAVILVAASAEPNELINSATFRFARAATYIVMNFYAIKMAAVFMISTLTVVIYTGIAPRWIAVLGYLLALVLLAGSYYISWSFAVLPLWVFLISVYILRDNLRR